MSKIDWKLIGKAFLAGMLIALTIIGVLWALSASGVWNFTSGLNVECADVLCEMRRPLEWYNQK